MLFQGNTGSNLKDVLIQECENVALGSSDRLHCSTLNGDITLSSTTAYGSETEVGSFVGYPSERNIPERSNPESDFGTSDMEPLVDGGKTKCPCGCVLTELEDMKINIEVLQSQMDALQSLANAQKVCFSINEYSNEINRLNQELLEERNKTNQLELDLDFLRRRVFDLEHKQNSSMPTVRKLKTKIISRPRKH